MRRDNTRMQKCDHNERFNLAHDLGDFRQVCGDAGRLDLAPVIFDAWVRLPDDDRGALRGTFTLALESGASASVGLPADTYPYARPHVRIGAELPVAELPSALAHELAHVFLKHLDADAAERPARMRFPPGALSPEVIAAALATGDYVARDMTPAELDRERAAWRQVAAWGFPVPDAWGE